MSYPIARSTLLAAACAASFCGAACAASFSAAACQTQSGPDRVPVLELYTSEGCSSCPPADRWLSELKGAAAQGRVVAQAFHVGYWDYIGWVDRFATPAYTARQREIAARNGLGSIYTPQLMGATGPTSRTRWRVHPNWQAPRSGLRAWRPTRWKRRSIR